MSPSAAPAKTRNRSELLAAARALGASGGAARVMALLYDPAVEIQAVLDCLRAEPGLAARVLKVANAPYYRQAGNVGTVDRAVALLGLTAIRGVAASGCLDRLTPPRSGLAFDPERFRLHSLAVACAAQQLSDSAGLRIGGEAYMAGLLHDIGLLLLVKTDAAAMASYQPPDSEDPACISAAEEAHFGTTHEACALLLTQSWQMPDWLAQAITQHHHDGVARPQAPGLAALPTVLALADHLARVAGFGLTARPAGEAASTHGLALGTALGLTEAPLLGLVESLPETIAALQGAS